MLERIITLNYWIHNNNVGGNNAIICEIYT